MKTLSVSQIQRNLHHLEEFDILEVIDKKRNKLKGYFVDAKYKDLIDSIIKKEKNSSLNQFAGMWKDRDVTQESIRAEAWK